MRRRTLLRVTGVSLATAVAGCSDGTIDDTKRTPAPTETPSPTAAIERQIRALWTAYNNENAEGIVEILHPDSPEQVSTDTITFQGTVTVESLTVVEHNETTATADATVTVSDGSRSITEQHSYELRRDEGDWAIWSFTTGTDEQTASPTA